jgi:hypothetical protein
MNALNLLDALDAVLDDSHLDPSHVDTIKAAMEAIKKGEEDHQRAVTTIGVLAEILKPQAG